MEDASENLADHWSTVLTDVEGLDASQLSDPERYKQYVEATRGPFTQQIAELRSRVTEALAGWRTEQGPTPQNAEKIKQGEALLAQFDRFIEVLPFWKLKHLAKALAEIDAINLTEDQLEASRKLYADTGGDETGQRETFLAILNSPDPLGIALRGHVSIEIELDALINSLMLHPIRLFEDLGYFFRQKVVLAHALGLLHDDEKKFLIQLNRIRNALGHARPKKGAADTRYVFNVAEEQQLWLQFVSVKSFEGFWPGYDRANFRMYLKAMVMTAQFLLYERAKRLSATIGTGASERLRLYRLDNMLRSGIVMMFVRGIPKVMTMLGKPGLPF